LTQKETIETDQKTIDSKTKPKPNEFIDMLLRLNRTTDVCEPCVDSLGIDDIKNRMVFELNKSWDDNKLMVVYGLLKELEESTPYGIHYLFQALESFLTSIHEKTKLKTDTVF